MLTVYKLKAQGLMVVDQNYNHIQFDSREKVDEWIASNPFAGMFMYEVIEVTE